MPALTEMDRVALEDLAREELAPGTGLISQGHCDQWVVLGLASGSWKTGYSLTDEGRSALETARDNSGG